MKDEINSSAELRGKKSIFFYSNECRPSNWMHNSFLDSKEWWLNKSSDDFPHIQKYYLSTINNEIWEKWKIMETKIKAMKYLNDIIHITCFF